MALKTHHGACHCGAVRFTAKLDLAAGTSRCNCSICGKGRFWKAIVKEADFHLRQGGDVLSDYQFGNRIIHHLFCRQCGIKPFGRGHHEALGGTFYAVNVACLEDANDAELAAAPVKYEDGRHSKWDCAPAETRHM